MRLSNAAIVLHLLCSCEHSRLSGDGAPSLDFAVDSGAQESSAPTHLVWENRFNGQWDNYSTAVAVDPTTEYIYLVGAFKGKLTIGGSQHTSNGGYDVYVSSFVPDGTLRWSRTFGGVEEEGTASLPTIRVAVGEGDVYVAGSFSAAMSVDTTQLTSLGGRDIFVVKLNTDGKYKWAVSHGSSEEDRPWTMAVDSSGVYVGGQTVRPGIPGGPGISNALVVAYDQSGSMRWSKTVEGGVVRGLALGAQDMVLAGDFAGAIEIGTTKLESVGSSDIFLVNCDVVSGTPLWAKRAGGLGHETLTGVSRNTDNNLILTGTFDKSTDLGGGQLNAGIGRSSFIAGFTGDGEHSWSTLGPAGQLVRSHAVSGQSILLAGNQDDGQSGGCGANLGSVAFLKSPNKTSWYEIYGKPGTVAFGVATAASGLYVSGLVARSEAPCRDSFLLKFVEN